MNENIYRKIIEYLKSNPGAMPREIADALGISIGMVRIALLRLRELGYVVRSSKGGYVVKSSSKDIESYGLTDVDTRGEQQKIIKKDNLDTEINELRSEVNELKKVIESLCEKVSKIEAEFTLLMKSLKSEKKVKDEVSEVGKDVIMRIDVARNRGVSVESLVRSGNYVIVGNYLVSQSFMEEFRKRFPISLKEIKSLTNEERELLNAMVSEGLAYLYAGKEYRLA